MFVFKKNNHNQINIVHSGGCQRSKKLTNDWPPV